VEVELLTTEPVGLDQMGTFLLVARLIPWSSVYIVGFVSALETILPPIDASRGRSDFYCDWQQCAKEHPRHRGIAGVEVKQRLFPPLGRVVGIA
jgi:hypothetical protein